MGSRLGSLLLLRAVLISHPRSQPCSITAVRRPITRYWRSEAVDPLARRLVIPIADGAAAAGDGFG